MAGTAKGCVYRPVVTRKRAGKKVKARSAFYWTKYRNADGIVVRHALKLPTRDGVRDKGVARELLRAILLRVEREAAGLVDRSVESASMPMRVVLARYLQHLRGLRRSREHIEQVRSYVKWMIQNAGITRLADFNEERVDQALRMIVGKGRSPRTVNAYRSRAHSLAEWCVKVPRFMDRNPVKPIIRRNEGEDTRKVRRALSIEEAWRLLDVSGPRRLFYAVQLWTGLRVGDSEALEWRDVELEGERPCIRLRAATTKAKRADEIPLYPDLAAALRDAKPAFAQPTDRVFKTVPNLATFKGGSYWRKLKKGKKRCHRKGDLDRAGIPPTDDKGRTLDLHALKTTFVSWLGLYGVDPRAQTILARHAPQGVTMKHYQDFAVFDLWAEIQKLPGMTAPAPGSMKATGTCDAGGVVPGVVPTGRIDRVPTASICTGSGFGGDRGRHQNPCFGAENRISAGANALPTPGLEPGTSCSTGRRSNQLSYAGSTYTHTT